MDILNFVYNKNLKNILLYIIMSSNVQYKKNRVDNFIAMYNNYTNATLLNLRLLRQLGRESYTLFFQACILQLLHFC